MKVAFPFFAQDHQVLHALPIAAQLASAYPGIDVHVAGRTHGRLDFIEGALKRFAPQAPVQVDRLRSWCPSALKVVSLALNVGYLRDFDAVVVPERTSLHLRRHLPKAQLIWTRHGAGDRAIGFAEDVHHFDFVTLAGPKVESRLLSKGLIRPGYYAPGVYAKFDWLSGCEGPRLFRNDRPTVLYAPHFSWRLSSWRTLGRAILDHFARSDRYNLVFAPHVRMFDRPTPAKYAAFRQYMDCPNIHVDLGSARSVDMTYTNAADLYLGDVSSQVVEFALRPRPCVFLNPRRVDWRNHPDYRFWRMGPVLESLDGFDDRLEEAFAGHGAYVDAQRHYAHESFGAAANGPSAPRAAAAIVAHLERVRQRDRVLVPVYQSLAGG